MNRVFAVVYVVLTYEKLQFEELKNDGRLGVVLVYTGLYLVHFTWSGLLEGREANWSSSSSNVKTMLRLRCSSRPSTTAEGNATDRCGHTGFLRLRPHGNTTVTSFFFSSRI